MKPTILILLLLFMASVLLSPFTKGIEFPANTAADISTAKISFNDLINCRIYSKDNSLNIFSKDESYIVVLKNNHNCIDCFRQINEFAHANKNETDAHFIVISQIDSTTLDRKRNFSENNRLMPDFDKFLFEYHNQSQNNLFDMLQINYTPEILIINHDKIYHIPYSQIFDHATLSMSTAVQIKIGELLK
jgi:hypothetical protein